MSEDMANVCASLCGMAPLRPYGVTLFVDMHDGLTGCFRQPTPHSDSVCLQVLVQCRKHFYGTILSG